MVPTSPDNRGSTVFSLSNLNFEIQELNQFTNQWLKLNGLTLDAMNADYRSHWVFVKI